MLKYLLCIICIFLLVTIKERFVSSNSLNVNPTGVKQRGYKEQAIYKKIKNIPVKQHYKFQSDKYIPTLTKEERNKIEKYIKNNFPNMLQILRFQKEQHKNTQRYKVVFSVNDGKPYNHIVLANIMVENEKIFFSTLEYGGMAMPQEFTTKQEGEEFFFINQTPNKIVFLDDQIRSELDKFEKRRIEILLRRGRKAA